MDAPNVFGARWFRTWGNANPGVDMSKMNLGIETSSWIMIAGGILVAAVGYSQTSDLASGPFLVAGIGGAILAGLGAYSAWAGATDRSRSTKWPGVAAIVVGLGLAAYPWFVGVTDTFLYSVSASGVIVAVAAAYETYLANRSDMRAPRRPPFA